MEWHPARRFRPVAAGLAASLLLAAGCGGDDRKTTTGAEGTTTAAKSSGDVPVIDPGDGGAYNPTIDAANFVDEIDNPYMPLTPGMHWVYEGEGERIEVTVTNDRVAIMGISATVVRDTVSEDGEITEDTFDWFAQDKDGNVWYLGEDTKEYEEGKVSSTEGSWKAGEDGALPGIVMTADPKVGDAYRQEYYPGEAEDLAEVARLGVDEKVPYGELHDLLVIKEWNPLEPDTIEEKYYAKGIGVVLEVKLTGEGGREELISFENGT